MIPISTRTWMRFALAAAVGLAVSASTAEAQRPVPAKPKSQTTQTQSRRDQIVPPAFFPPTGMCRIWLNDVPAGQQPAPTDCASAVRNRPTNGVLVPVQGSTDCSYARSTTSVGDIIFGRTNLATNCRDVYSREDGAWYQVGRGRDNSSIYERRVRNANGNLVIQRARRNSN